MRKTKKWIVALMTSAVVITLAACNNSSGNEVVKLGVVGENNEPWEYVDEQLEDEGIDLEIVTFSDYNQPNSALAEGEVDLNAFQHQIFLDNYNSESGTDLQTIGETVFAPLGIYSEKIEDVSDIREGDSVIIPNDVTNGGRAILLLQTAGLIEVNLDAGATPTLSDITSNPLNLEITEVDPSQTARAVSDVTISIINSGMAVDAGYVPTEDAIFLEEIDDSFTKPYVNIIAARSEDVENETYQKIVDEFQTAGTAEVIAETTAGSSIPAFDY